MADTQKLRKAIKHFEFYSTPSNAMGGAPATVDDIRKLIKNTAKLLNEFVDELEKET